MKKWTWIALLAVLAILLALWSVPENFDTYADALKDVGQTAGYIDTTKPATPTPSSSTTTASAATVANKISDPTAPSPTCLANFTLKASEGYCEDNKGARIGPMCSSGYMYDTPTKACKVWPPPAAPTTYTGTMPVTADNIDTCLKARTPDCNKLLMDGVMSANLRMEELPACKSVFPLKRGEPFAGLPSACKSAITDALSKGSPSTPAAPVPPAAPAEKKRDSTPVAGTSPTSASDNLLFGPKYTSLGETVSSDGADEAAGRRYPALLGPRPRESKFLPSSGSTASDEMSAFFSTSRISAKEGSKGTAKLGPDGKPIGGGIADDFSYDPSKVGNAAFTTASGSYKTEPIPFLTDFSAFFK